MSDVQSDIDLIFSWLSSRFLSINLNKTKYMIVTHKSSSFSQSLTPLYVNHSRLELVYSFKYLGVIISSNLSWSAHICSKSRQLVGVIFRHFYRNSSPQSLLKMYIALVLPHLSYCSSVWDPPSGSSLASELEKVQKFALRMCTYNWFANYLDLLSNFQHPSLSSCRSQSKLFIVYKILNNLIFICIPPPIRSSRSYHPLNVLTPYCKTSSTLNSFVPSASSLWNSLPHHLKSSRSFPQFKSSLKLLKLNL